MSKGAFYGYFDSKQALILALLDADAAALDEVMDGLARSPLPDTERIRRFVRQMLELAEDPSRVQVRADLWAAVLTDKALRRRLTGTVVRRRAVLREWVEGAVAAGEIAAVPTNALASTLLALGDGLSLHGTLDPDGFRWSNIRKAFDVLLEGLRA